jgi:hypothetical protein
MLFKVIQRESYETHKYNLWGKCRVTDYTGCNRIRYTNLKIYCDKVNSNIKTQFLAEPLLTLQHLLRVFNVAATGYATDIQTIFFFTP